ncbi:TerB family tellurite resistance protein [Desulfovibrio sp. JC022]|uniref:TerB family tellurite resistance protein n=1 Tax=Desulfovibrio sp. JC022 TaxID=2593642 RepID=UPI0013D416B6|nr:TerB family tellurite resistance protein [Desulfovibrio sp. JC022]NDV24731.1 hypothetical protein [Desulfovibrio sp. JC022]
MGFWKVVGGAALGVACVVAAPVAGPVGAVTALGAAVAGTAGAVAGGVAELCDDSEEEAKKEGYRDGRKDGLAEQAEKVKILQDKISHAAQKFTDQKKQEEFLIGLLAVGFAISSIDGNFEQNEEEDVNAFVLGLSQFTFSNTFTEKINELKATPPKFDGAMLYVKSYIPKRHWDLVDELLFVAAEADGSVCDNEKKFMKNWIEFKASH